jgi:exodeoxyribonuclease VII small subunit
VVEKNCDKSPTLEEAYTEISELIDKMEHTELTLEQSLTHFERGIKLIKHCQKILGEAEQKVQILIQHNQQEELTAYQDNDKNQGLPSNDHKDG